MRPPPCLPVSSGGRRPSRNRPADRRPDGNLPPPVPEAEEIERREPPCEDRSHGRERHGEPRVGEVAVAHEQPVLEDDVGGGRYQEPPEAEGGEAPRVSLRRAATPTPDGGRRGRHERAEGDPGDSGGG